ncbi:Type II traffic warden ATPase (plasmid) [Variovorax sp. SRS16]|uniref:GspE/PulE family protein n=1 Tax=Variovorax sp. SRS16 TaxID=282217 RepID=UPI0013177046|nr:ATPase, T2SS/T4P/T4SS family [Variovorax sp. SRS16]VTU46181.1 Type II traffic warden ATPase [Variovorax sp. SRS16]
MFFRKVEDAASAGVALAPSPIARTVAPIAIEELSHFKTFADVPKFQKALSAGIRPLIALPQEVREKVVVVEQPGRIALVVQADVDRSQLESIKGKLREHNYALRVATADPVVIRDIYQGAGEAGDVDRSARAGNEFMKESAEWVAYAVQNRATDIHLEVRGSIGVVRVRVDGELEAMKGPNGGRYTAKFMEQCMASLFNNDQQSKSGSDSLFDKEKFLYCMVPYSERGLSLKLRFQSMKGNEGPKTVLRLLHVDENQPTLTFEQLGYAPSHVALWEQAMQTPSGMVLIAGVTGSGKSTLLKSFIELNPNTPRSAVSTIEDPVEYPIRGAHQIPIQRDLSDGKESAKRYAETIGALMRSDPDIVMLGEIRDHFSANAAQQLAETGHMALGTVHAHLLSGIVPRLVNPEIGFSRQILTAPNIATLFAYQALVAKLCPACCMGTTEASQHDLSVATIAGHMKTLGIDAAPMRWKRIGGCTECRQRGTVGLTVAAEMLMPDEEWLRPIREGRDTDAVEVYRSRSNGRFDDPDMTGKTVFEHTLYKALAGQVDARQCSRFDTWHRFMLHANRRKQPS